MKKKLKQIKIDAIVFHGVAYAGCVTSPTNPTCEFIDFLKKNLKIFKN